MEPAGSAEAQRIAECKRRMADIAERHGAGLVDFYRGSPLTRADENFWDALHYRAPVGRRVIEVLAALRAGTAADAPDGSWVILARPHAGGTVGLAPAR
jgi:hypothetical protein